MDKFDFFVSYLCQDMKFYFNSLAISDPDLKLFCALLNSMGDTYHCVEDNNGNTITLVHTDYGIIL